MKQTIPLKYGVVVLGVLLGFLTTSMVYATSRVFVQNNTSKTLVINTTSTLGGAYWKKKDRVIPPWGRGEIYETNRDEGVKDGKTYIFTSDVSVKGENGTIKQHQQNFALRLKLRGSTVNSHMWQSVRDQVDRQHTWHDDRKKWNAKMRIGQRQWNVKYWAYYAVTEDNVEYVFQEEYPKPVWWNKTSGEWFDNHLNILTWNVFMRGFPLAEYQSGRAKMIAPKVPGYDVIAFNEVFDHDGEAILKEAIKKAGYPHQTHVLGRGRPISKGVWNGGVMIVSKYPIVKTDEAFYDDHCDSDCNADKGVLYAKIDKSRKKGAHNFFHIFATHMNQGGPEWKHQREQLKIIEKLIAKQKIPGGEPIIVLGDTNVNKCKQFADGPMTIDPVPKAPVHECKEMHPNYLEMLDILNARDVDSKGYKFTLDGNINGFNNWETDPGLRPIHKGRTSQVDHILIVKNDVKPTEASFTETRILRHTDEWKKLETDLARWEISDHFSVYGNLHFRRELGFDPGIDTRQLTRYYSGKHKDIVAVATTNGHDAVKQQGYNRVGDHGLLFRNSEAATKWAKDAPKGSGKTRVALSSSAGRKGSKSRRSFSRIRSRGIPQEGEPAEEIGFEVLEDSGTVEEDTEPLELSEEDLLALEETYQEIEEDMASELAMESNVEESGQIVERGLRRKASPRRLLIRPSSKSSTKPAPQSSGRKMTKARKKGFRIVQRPVVPLNLYYSDKYKEYFSTTSFIRAKKAMQGAGKYRHVGVQGYVFSQTMFKKLPNSLRSRLIPMTSWYNSKTRDNLIATSPGDRQHAKQNGYRQIGLEGYLIVDKPMPPKGCKANSDCPSSHYCDVKQKVCRPDIR